ncbi:MAG TPA: PEP-CTERM sorting domain-containing protein, partial [Candidatus Methylacidiphilales bacterium]
AVLKSPVAPVQVFAAQAGATGDFNTATNWDNGAVPSGAAATFSASGTTAVNVSANTSVTTLSFLAGSQAYTFTTGTGVTLTVSTINNLNTASAETFSGQLALTGASIKGAVGSTTIFDANSNLTLSGASVNVAVGGGSNAGSVYINGAVTLGAGNYINFNATSTSTLYYNAANQTNIGAGAYLSVGDANNTSAGGVLELMQSFAGSSGIQMVGYNVSNTGNRTANAYLGAAGLNNASTVTMAQRAGSVSTQNYVNSYFGSNIAGTASTQQSGAITLATAASYCTSTINFDVQNANTMTISGAITSGTTTGTGSSVTVNKIGTGTLILSNANNQLGSIGLNVTGGLLLNNGATTVGAVNVNGASGAARAALGGTGTLNASGVTLGAFGGINVSGGGAVPLFSGGTVGPGTLTLNLGSGSLDMSAVAGSGAGELTFVLGSVSDKVKLSSATSTLVLGSGLLGIADFNLIAGSGFGAGTYILFDTASAGGISGSLAGSGLSVTANGYTYTLFQGTDASGFADIGVTVAAAVPEPGTLALLLLGGGVALGAASLRRRTAVAQGS